MNLPDYRLDPPDEPEGCPQCHGFGANIEVDCACCADGCGDRRIISYDVIVSVPCPRCQRRHPCAACEGQGVAR